MGDSGEGLVDANSRIEERMEETKESRRLDSRAEPINDPEKMRALASLRLTRVDLERQFLATVHEARRTYLQSALDEIDRRIDGLQPTNSKQKND